MKQNDFEMMENIEIPSRSQLKSDELCYFSDMIFKSKDGFYNAIISVYRLGYYRGVKRERLEARKKRSAHNAREKDQARQRVTE